MRHHYLRAAAKSGELPKLEGDEDALVARFHDEDGAIRWDTTRNKRRNVVTKT